MPAFYAHNRFGEKVAQKTDGELNEIISKYYVQFQIGLQGPDIFFFYRPWKSNRVSKYGYHLHEVSAASFFTHALTVVKEKGRDSREYAYLLGFICHYILDSECHPYVSEMMEALDVEHLEIEEEFEKMLLRKDGKNALSYPLADLIPTDSVTAKTIYPFYRNMNPVIIREALKDLKLVKRIFTAPCIVKQAILNGAMHLTGKYDYWKGLMHQRKDNPKCTVSNEGLYLRFKGAVDIAVTMLYSFDESLCTGTELHSRFERTFE